MLCQICRSQARLQKLGNQLSTYLLGNEGNGRDADVDIVSDEENNVRNLRIASDSQNELQNTSSLSRKRHYVDQYSTKEPVEDGKLISTLYISVDTKFTRPHNEHSTSVSVLIGRGEEEKAKRPSRWNTVPSKSFSEEESGGRNDEDTISKFSSKEDNWKRTRFSSGTSSTNKVLHLLLLLQNGVHFRYLKLNLSQ